MLIHSPNIFLDNIAALRGFKLFLNRIFILLKQSKDFHIALSYSAYATAILAYHLPCVSKWVCDAALWQQTHEYSQRLATLGTFISSTAIFHILTLSRKMTWRRCLSISHPFRISPIARFTCSAMRPMKVVRILESGINVMWYRDGRAYQGFKNSRWRRKPWSSTTKMSWLSRVINLMTFSVISYRNKWVLKKNLNAARETVILQMLHVTVGLLLLSNWSYFHTADCCLSNASMCLSSSTNCALT